MIWKSNERLLALNLHSRLLTVGALVLVALPSNGVAGTLIESHLATLTEVTVRVATGGLLYQPTPGFNAPEFEESVAEIAKRELAKCEISTKDASDQRLLLSFHKTSTHRDTPDSLVFIVRLDLTEPATLLRSGPEATTSESVIVTSWQAWDVLSVKSDGSLDALRESATSLVMEFAQKVAVARAEYGIQPSSGDRSDCLE